MQAALQSTSHAATCIHCSIWVKMTARKILNFILEFLIRARPDKANSNSHSNHCFGVSLGNVPFAKRLRSFSMAH